MWMQQLEMNRSRIKLDSHGTIEWLNWKDYLYLRTGTLAESLYRESLPIKWQSPKVSLGSQNHVIIHKLKSCLVASWFIQNAQMNQEVRVEHFIEFCPEKKHLVTFGIWNSLATFPFKLPSKPWTLCSGKPFHGLLPKMVKWTRDQWHWGVLLWIKNSLDHFPKSGWAKNLWNHQPDYDK